MPLRVRGLRVRGLRVRPPRLWTLLLASNLAVLALPLTGLWAMRLYESALVRQTESELVAQAVVWTAAFRQELRQIAPDAAPAPAVVPGSISPAAISLLRLPGLDLAEDPVLPPPPDPAPVSQPADPRAIAIGQALEPMLREAQAITLSALRLTDAHGVVVASTGPDLGKSLVVWDEVARVLGGAPIATSMRRRDPVQASFGSLSRTAGLRVFVALPVQGTDGLVGAVVLSRTPRDVWQTAWGKRWQLAGLAAFLLSVGVLLAAGLSRLVARPIAVVVAQAEQVALGGDMEALRRPGTREVASLSAALTRMAAMLDQRARYIMAFAANVSHEFKTPLAGLRGAAELLEDHADTLQPVERAKLLAIVANSTARLDHLVRRLLDLARADMVRSNRSAATAIGRVLEDLLPRYQERGLTVMPELGPETVALSPDALAAVLSNLLDNAAAHAGGDAAVTITARSSNGLTAITVADNGPGISSANRSRVFDPFFTTARESGGTGLGLSIVRAIAVGAGGTARLVESPTGACFCIELPQGPAVAGIVKLAVDR